MFWVILANIVKTILLVKKYAALLKNLKDGQLVRGLISDVIVGSVTDALVSAGIPVDSYKIVGEAQKYFEMILDEKVSTLVDNNVLLTLDDLARAFDRKLAQLRAGLSVGNGRPPTRHSARGADPILLHRGEFEHASEDMVVRGAGADLTLRRIYRSGADYLGPIGRGWDHSFNLRLVESDARSLHVLTGDLSEQHFFRHPEFGNAGFDYYAPQAGVHSVVVPDAGSYRLRRPGGSWVQYESAGPGRHRARSLHDPSGNQIDLDYDADGNLRTVYANGPNRYLAFEYRSDGLLEEVHDHVGRTCHYLYNESGLLVRAQQFADVAGEPSMTAASYEYAPVGDRPQLTRLCDETGRVLVQNEYDLAPSSSTFGYVLNQYTERGPTSFVYEKLSPANTEGLLATDIPDVRVFETPPDGHVVEHVLNSTGNELMRREDYVQGGRMRTALIRSRYNVDGAVVARMDGEGGLVQSLYGREHAERGSVDELPVSLERVSATERLAFGNELATIERGRAMAEFDSVSEQSDWIAALPSTYARDDPDDAIVKRVFSPVHQLLVSTSDVRATVSPDPLHVESAPPGSTGYDPTDPAAVAHRNLLTVHDYTATGLRIRTTWPRRTPADGSSAVQIAEKMLRWDIRGRPLAQRDRRGYITYREYYSEVASGARAGYLRRAWRPHTDWTLNVDFPPILEAQRRGSWTASDDALTSTGSDASLRLQLHCQRIELWQTRQPVVAATCSNARVFVDGQPYGTWNQQSSATYLIDGLAPGAHVIEIAAAAAGLMVGRVIGHVVTVFDVDELGRVVASTNSRGVITRTDYDSHDRVVSRRCGTGNGLVADWTEFDRDGEIVCEKRRWCDSDGNPIAGGLISVSYRYDLRGLPTIQTTQTGDPGDRRAVRFYFDTRGVMVAQRNGRGIRTCWRVDPLGRQVREIRGACTRAESITDTRYDRCGRPVCVTDPLLAQRLTDYTPRGMPHTQRDPIGTVTSTRYDLGRRPVVEQRFGRHADGSYELASRLETAYDELGDMVSKTEALFHQPIPAATPDGDSAFLTGCASGDITISTQRYVLDPEGRQICILIDGVEQTRRSFDPAGRIVDERLSTGRRVVWVYDGEGNAIRKYALDPAENPVDAPASFLETYAYDAHNRRVTTRDYYGNAWGADYDTVGNTVGTVDPLGGCIYLQHNAFGQEVARIEGDPAVTVRSSYDRAGNRSAVADEGGHLHVFTHDALDRVVHVRNTSMPTDPGTRTDYDRCDRVVAETDRCGVITRHRYDVAGRRVRTDWDWTTAATTPSPLSATYLIIDYDARGHPCRHINDWAVVEQRRDSRGQVCEERTRLLAAPGPGLDDWTVTQAYDTHGRRRTLEFPSGRRVNYARDASGRVRRIDNAYTPAAYPGSPLTTAPATLADHRYGGDRWLWLQTPPAGCAMRVDHDGRGQECQRTVTNLASGAVMWRRQAFLDPARNTAFETITTAGGDGRTRHFTLDARRRLVGYHDGPAVWLDATTQAPPRYPVAASRAAAQATIDAVRSGVPPENSIVYDDTCNRTLTQEGAGVPIASTVDAANRYINVGPDIWQYDDDGRVLVDSQRRYTYDAAGLLSEEFRLGPGGGREVAYVRDGLARTIYTLDSAGTHRFAWLDHHLLVTWDPNGGFTEFTPGRADSELLHVAAGFEDAWVFTDPVGTARLVLRRGGPVAADVEIGHLPFGQNEAAAGDESFGFAGLLRFPNSVLLHAVHRSYDPRMGRFVQQDPAGYTDGLNRYVYARNNPIDLVDPLGLEGLSPSTMRILEYMERVAALINDDPSQWDESPQVRGMNKHQEFAFAMDRTNSFSEGHPLHNFFADGNDADRIASEVWIDDRGIIQKINGDPYNAPTGWRTVDAAVVKEGLPGGKHSIVGQRAEDVIDFVVDYKTGNAALKDRMALEALIGNKPVVRVLGRTGQLLGSLTRRFKYLAAVKLAVKAGRWGIKRAGQALPVVGFFVTYAANADASTEMRIARGVAGEVGIGPLDLEMAYDAADWTFDAVQDGIHAFADWATPRVLGALDGRSRQQITRGLGF